MAANEVMVGANMPARRAMQDTAAIARFVNWVWKLKPFLEILI
jgi:hypothetical protein